MTRVQFFASARLGLACVLGTGAAGRGSAQPPARVGGAASPAAPAVPAATPATVLAAAEVPIDLATALRLAGAQNPELLLARERVTEADAVRRLAAAQALPNINVGGNYDLHRGNLQQASGNILRIDRDSLYTGFGSNAVGAGTVANPGLSYNLNVGAAVFGYLQSRQLVALAAANARTAENDTLLRVCLAHAELVRASARLAIQAENVAEATELARLTAAYAKAGQGRQADADRASVELRRREAEQSEAQADQAAASARLARLLSLDPVVRLRPAEPAAVPASVAPVGASLPDLVATALTSRPELEESRAEIQAALIAVSGARLAPLSPNVILGFSVGAFGGGSDLAERAGRPRFGDFDGRRDLDAAVFFTLQNLGVGNVAQLRRAESLSRQADLRLRGTMNRVGAEVAESDARARAKLAQIDLANRALLASQGAFDQDLARIRGREGLPIEAIDSLRLLARSRGEYLDAIIDYNAAQFRLYVALGRPSADALARATPVAPPPAEPKAGDKPKPADKAKSEAVAPVPPPDAPKAGGAKK